MVIDGNDRALWDCDSYERYETKYENRALGERTYFRPEGVLLALFVFLKNNVQNLLVCKPSGLNFGISVAVHIKLESYAPP